MITKSSHLVNIQITQKVLFKFIFDIYKFFNLSYFFLSYIVLSVLFYKLLSNYAHAGIQNINNMSPLDL